MVSFIFYMVATFAFLCAAMRLDCVLVRASVAVFVRADRR